MNHLELILAAIGVMTGLFGLLVGIIVFSRVRAQIRARLANRRRAVLEPVVMRYAGGAGGRILENLVEVLGHEPGKYDLIVLERILLEQSRAVKGSVRLRLIQAFEDLGIVGKHVLALSKGRVWMRSEAAERLGQIRSPRASEALIKVMDDPAPEVRLRAARALGGIGGAAAVSKLIAALAEPNRWSAMRIADILTDIGEEAVDDLIREMGELPVASRLLVIDVFGRVRSLKAIPVLRDLLADAEPDIRARAAHALGQIGDPGSATDLIGCLSDEAWPVRAMAAKALGRIPGNEQVEALCEALTDSEWWVRANAAEALKHKGEQGKDALVGMLDSSDTYASEQAVLMLQESGVLDTLISQLDSEEKAIRDRSLFVLARMVDLRRTHLLTDMAERHPDQRIRQLLTMLLGLPETPAVEGA